MINANQGVSATNAAGHGLGGDLKCATATFTINGALTTGQVIPMLAVPAGARIVDAKFAAEGFADGAFSLGDAADAGRFFTDGAPGARQTGGELHLYKKSCVLSLKVSSVPTAASGALKLAVFYVMDGVSPRDV